jgi:hypothetical protein
MKLPGINRVRVFASWVLFVALLAGPVGAGLASGQTRYRVRPPVRTIPTPTSTSVEPPADREEIDTAMGFICSDRRRDPLGSAPIDLMQARPSLSLNHPDALAGANRSRRLLTLAKELTIKSLRQLGLDYGISQVLINQAAQRVLAVTEVNPDPDLRDNASVVMSNPKVINFGTIFLVGLPSDEGMVSVLSHELTHIADGRQGSLGVLFGKIGKRASLRTGLRISGQRAEELSCDTVGAMAVESLIARSPGSEITPRRMARAMEHNCVDSDDTDDEHLSPRSTMRALLALDPRLTRTVIGALVRPEAGGSVAQQMNLLSLGMTR